MFSIVVADDDTDDQYLIQKAILDNRNHCIYSVYNGFQLMNLLLRKGKYKNDKEGLPDLILLDINMPIMNGFDALAEIKANTDLKDIPVFILSSGYHEHDVKKFSEMGIVEFYQKPTQYSQLKKIIEDVFSKVELIKAANENTFDLKKIEGHSEPISELFRI